VLKITMTETPAERRWVVQGRLVGPWVSELRTTWKRTHRSRDKRTCVIDLSDVTFIDKGGERLLRAMSKKGAQLVAEGVYIKHVIEQVKNSGMPSADGTVQNLSSDRMARTEEQ
jgi:anti-anti-sigma regulatory factor